MIARSQIHWMTEAGMFFQKSGPVWDTLRDLESKFQQAKIEYVIIGGLALNAYEYARQTTDVDVVLTPEGFQKFREQFEGKDYTPTPGAPRRFTDQRSEVPIDILIAGELAGHRKKNNVIRFPDPKEAKDQGDLHTVSLAKLIELKLVTWRYKDWGDVVELIRRNKLDESFATQLAPLVQTAYQECFDQANDEDYGPR